MRDVAVALVLALVLSVAPAYADDVAFRHVMVVDNPLSSIEALKDIRMIVNDGTVVFNKVDQ